MNHFDPFNEPQNPFETGGETAATAAAGGAESAELPSVTIVVTEKMLKDLNAAVNTKTYVTVLLMGLFCLALGIVFFLLDYFYYYQNDFLAMLLTVVGIVMLLLLLLLVLGARTNVKNSLQIKNQAQGTLWFGDKITEIDKSLVAEGKAVYEWAAIVKARETAEYFFLFVDSGRAWCVLKTDLRNCTTAGFRGLLRSKLGDRLT